MAQTETPENELRRALALADGYLSEAETILWTTTNNLSDEEMADAVEGLTHDLWAVQHQLQDLQRELRDEDTHYPTTPEPRSR